MSTIMQLLLSSLLLIVIVVLEISFHVISHIVPWTLRKRPDGTFSYVQIAMQFAIFGPLILLSLVAIGYAIVDFQQRVRAA